MQADGNTRGSQDLKRSTKKELFAAKFKFCSHLNLLDKVRICVER